MKTIRVFTLLLIIFLQLNIASAQCPATVTAFIQSQTNATCPSNGQLVIGSNANGVASAQYQFTTAPAGISLAAQASNTFTSLLPGAYTIKVTCGASSATVNATITTTYVQLTASTTISNTCVNFTKGGRITVIAANGTAPYTYSILKTNNANYSDNLSVYGSSNIFNTTDSGTFQIRIKDACSNFITKTVIIEPSQSALKVVPNYVLYDQPCNSGNVSLQFGLEDINNIQTWIGSIPGGIKFDIYKKGAGCTRGDFIRTQIFPEGHNTQLVVIPQNQNVYIKVTNVCGDTTAACYTIPSGGTNFKTFWVTTLTGCGDAAYPNGYMSIGKDYSVNGTNPISNSVIKLVGGAVVRNPTFDSSIFTGLPYGEYVVVAVDACGKISKDTVYVPSVSTPASFSGWTDLECISQTGTLHYRTFVDGFIQDIKNAVITITSGPSNVGVVGNKFTNIPIVEWWNIVPGTYTASIVTPCTNKTVTFTVDASSTVLKQSLNVTTTQACNNGGVVYGQLVYNGLANITYELFNNVGVMIASNISGNFTGLASGTYSLRAKIEQWSECNTPPYYISKPAIIYPDGTPPQVTKKIGLICEDVNGIPTSVGNAIIRHSGFGPFKIEVKKIGEPDANYLLQTSNSVTAYTLTGLIPYENYRVRVTDACGNTALTDVAIGKLQQLNATNTLEPCQGAEYILSAPDFVDASYTWKLNGSVISNSRELVFPTYSNANNGTYECTMVIGGGCVTRVFTSILTGTCGVLPIKLESINATPNKCEIDIDWTTELEINANKFEIERSSSGNKFEKIGERISLYNNTSGKYHFIDKAPLNAVGYYRLKMIETDGTYTYSKIVSAKNNCEGSEKTLTIYPNPVINKMVNVNVSAMQSGVLNISFINLTGQIIQQEKLILNIGNTNKTIKLANATKGIYLVRILDEKGKELSTQKVMVE